MFFVLFHRMLRFFEKKKLEISRRHSSKLIGYSTRCENRKILLQTRFGETRQINSDFITPARKIVFINAGNVFFFIQGFISIGLIFMHFVYVCEFFLKKSFYLINCMCIMMQKRK